MIPNPAAILRCLSRYVLPPKPARSIPANIQIFSTGSSATTETSNRKPAA